MFVELVEELFDGDHEEHPLFQQLPGAQTPRQNNQGLQPATQHPDPKTKGQPQRGPQKELRHADLQAVQLPWGNPTP